MDEPPPMQNSIDSTKEQPVLILISHSHRRPLSSPPDLKFDLRKVSNPPKHIRDAYDGRSKRLREHMMHMEEFTSLLDTAKKSIEEEMEMLIRNGKGKSRRQVCRAA
jgi:RNase adaptor protein for sRNA GlmZ degradation